jgi:hypothetical protein
MAITVTIKNVSLNQMSQGQNGETKAMHMVTYVNPEGQEQKRAIFQDNPLFNQLIQYPLAAGKQVDIKQVKDGKFWRLTEIAKAGSIAVPYVPGQQQGNKSAGQKKPWTPAVINPERDISMELGGLMHDAVTMVAAGKGSSVEEMVKTLYLIKRRVTASIKDGTIDQPVPTAAVVEPPHETYTVENEDSDNPFPY